MNNLSDLQEFVYYRGRVGLYAILQALGIGSGDQVAIQAFTCLAVPEAVLAAGAEPLFVDIEQDGYNMCPDSLLKRVTPNTRAIVVQHTFGIPAQIDRILNIANKAGIPVIEDCCHALEGSYRTRVLGSFGVAAFYSFEWGKPLVAGLGGSVIVNCPELKKIVSKRYAEFIPPSISKQLKIEVQYQIFKFLYKPDWYWPVKSAFHTFSRLGVAEGNFPNLAIGENEISVDFKMTMSPSVKRRLAKKIASVNQITNHSQQVTNFYRTNIRSHEVIHPILSDDSETVFARYPLRVKEKAKLLKKARSSNVEVAGWYATPIHPIPAEQAKAFGYYLGSCPNAEMRSLETVSLPTNQNVSQGFLEKVIVLFDGNSI